MRISPSLIVGVAALLLAAALYPAGWFAPVAFPDTQGYEDALRQPNIWGHIRHPLYGWLLQFADAGPGRAIVPAVQFAAHALAAMVLAFGARVAGMDRMAATALGLAAVFGQSVIIWGNALLPEALASALFILALGLTLASTRGRLFWPIAVLLAAAAATACILRPIILPGVVVLPALYVLLAAMQRQGWRTGRAAGMALLIAAPLVLQAAHRQREVGDFNIVSFGGFGSLGLTAQILTPDIVPRLPEAQRALAVEVLAAKQRAVDAQTAMPLFRNSQKEPSFRATAIDGFDTFARNFDEILWGQIIHLRKPDESWVSFNARMGALGGAILRAAPDRHVMWMAGATSRLVGRILTYNVAFMLACIAFAAIALWNAVRHGRALGGGEGDSWTVMALVVGAWVVSTSALSVVAAFPALRYTDTGGLLLTAVPLYALFLGIAKTRSDAPR